MSWLRVIFPLVSLFPRSQNCKTYHSSHGRKIAKQQQQRKKTLVSSFSLLWHLHKWLQRRPTSDYFKTRVITSDFFPFPHPKGSNYPELTRAIKSTSFPGPFPWLSGPSSRVDKAGLFIFYFHDFLQVCRVQPKSIRPGGPVHNTAFDWLFAWSFNVWRHI